MRQARELVNKRLTEVLGSSTSDPEPLHYPQGAGVRRRRERATVPDSVHHAHLHEYVLESRHIRPLVPFSGEGQVPGGGEANLRIVNGLFDVGADPLDDALMQTEDGLQCGRGLTPPGSRRRDARAVQAFTGRSCAERRVGAATAGCAPTVA